MADITRLDLEVLTTRVDKLPQTIADRTRRIYDRMSFVYPLSTYFFHSKAHRAALEMSGIRDGMRVLEVATGSGEMFRRLVKRNPNGHTLGLDLSPNMAARTQRNIRREFPNAKAHCKAVDVRNLPFRQGTFDAVMCCYLLELLSSDDIARSLREIYRVTKEGGSFTLVLIGENADFFNRAYRICGQIAPAFWGRQVERRASEFIEDAGFRIKADRTVRQSFYPSRVVVAQR